MGIYHLLAAIGIVLVAFLAYVVVTDVSCDTSLRVDQHGIVLSDPCGNLQ